jgi:hypothetical protein
VVRSREEIFVELRDLCAQYKAEVPGRSQAWPKSIKERVIELQQMGLGDTEISKSVPISAQTMYFWRHSRSVANRSEFLPVKVVETSTVTVKKAEKSSAVGRPRKKPPKLELRTVIVTTPSGYRIEGLDAKEAAEFISRVEFL